MFLYLNYLVRMLLSPPSFPLSLLWGRLPVKITSVLQYIFTVGLIWVLLHWETCYIYLSENNQTVKQHSSRVSTHLSLFACESKISRGVVPEDALHSLNLLISGGMGKDVFVLSRHSKGIVENILELGPLSRSGLYAQ